MMDHALLDIVHGDVRQYLQSLATENDPLVVRLAAFAKQRGFPRLEDDAASVLELLARMIGARRVFELGSGFGYSAYFLARTVGEGGEVHGSELDPELVAAHAELFAAHPYRRRITLRQGDGEEILRGLAGDFDLVFIDAYKTAYPRLLATAVERVRVGGLVVADNVLWGGRVARPQEDDPITAALQEFNRMTRQDARLRTAILPVGDGLSVSLRVR